MKNLVIIFLLVMLAGCKKEAAEVPATSSNTPPAFIKYNISKGAHYCDKTTIKAFTGDHVSFNVIFDSSAVYAIEDSGNQYDINKLYGFTEGPDNHVNSARIGWRWNNNALRLYAYGYAAGKRSFEEISSVAIGATIAVTIGIAADKYSFSVDGKKVTLPRASTDSIVSGYWQYPYFGGDEVAPHDISIYILDLIK